MQLNEDKFELKLGIIFFIIWSLVLVFYLTWDGWIWEWNYFGYNGPNQHFDLNLFDLKIERLKDGEIIYYSTNNLHNLLYICFFVFFLGWFGLIFDSKWAKNGFLATSGISFLAALATMFPLKYHIYILQIIYDIIHGSAVVMASYLFSKERFLLKKALPAIFLTWTLYMLSRIALEPWPYWIGNKDAYFSLNQVNDMPFYFYGLEYSIVIAVMIGLNIPIYLAISRVKNRFLRVLTPFAMFMIVYFVIYSLGLIHIPKIDIKAWKVGI